MLFTLFACHARGSESNVALRWECEVLVNGRTKVAHIRAQELAVCRLVRFPIIETGPGFIERYTHVVIDPVFRFFLGIIHKRIDGQQVGRTGSSVESLAFTRAIVFFVK